MASDNLISVKQIRSGELAQFANNATSAALSSASGVLQGQINSLNEGSGINLADVPFRSFSFSLNSGQEEISIDYDFNFPHIPCVVAEITAPINSPIITHHVYNKSTDSCFISLSNSIPGTGYGVDLIIGLNPQS